MGVMACDRRECENIMCDMYSPKFGYICAECYEELTSRVQSIEEFMESPKESASPDVIDLVAHCAKVNMEFGL